MTLIGTAKAGLLSWRDDMARTLREGLPKRVAVLSGLLAVVAFGVFLTLVPKGFVNGDAPVYAERIAKLSLGDGSVHIGYYLVGVVFTRLVPLDPPLALNLMSALLGALCIGLVSMIAYTISGRMSASVAGAAALLCLPVFVDNAVFAEIYIVQLFFFLLCVQFVLWDRPIAAGVAFACAFLVTPSTILAAPFVMLLRPQRRFVALGVLSGALLAAAVLLPHYRDFLWGGIGVLHLQARDVSLAGALPKELREVGGLGTSLLGVTAGIGMGTLFGSRKRRNVAIAAVSLWLVAFLIGERYSDVPVQLPLYAILAVAAGIGAARLLHHWSRDRTMATVVVLVLAFSVALPGVATYPMERQKSLLADSFKADVRALADEAKRGDVVIAKWPSDRIARYYLDDRPFLTWLDYEALLGLSDQKAKDAEWSRLTSAVTARQRLWLIDTPQAGDYLKTQGYKMTQFKQFIFLATPGG